MVINPMWFYWLQVIDTLRGVMCAVSIIDALAIVISLLIGYVEELFDDKPWRRGMLIMAAVLATSVFTLIFVPSKKTIIEMMIARQVTAENIGAGVDAIKAAVDYIVQKLSEVWQ